MDKKRKKVMIVDDATIMRMILKEILEKENYLIIAEAKDGYEAVDLYKKHNPDIVSMDISMPYRDGIWALKEILDYNKKAKIIVCSALGQEALVTKAISIGARDFIVKPFRPERVVRSFYRVAVEK